MRLRLKEKISAYRDGEIAHPDTIERKLRQEPEVQAYLESLQQLSRILAHHKLPEASPSFTRRVMAAVEEEEMSGDLFSFRWLWVALPALLLLFTAAVLLYHGGINSTGPSLGGQDTYAKWAVLNDAQLFSLIEESIPPEEGGDIASSGNRELLPGWSEITGRKDELLFPDTIVSQEEVEVVFQKMDVLLSNELDSDVLVSNLSQEEQKVLEDLLQRYADEGRVS